MSITGSQNPELAAPVWYIIHGIVFFRSVWCPDTLSGRGRGAQSTPLEKPKTGDSPIQTVDTPSHARCSDKLQGGCGEAVQVRVRKPAGREASCEEVVEGCS